MSSPAKLIDILLVEDNACDIELTRRVFEDSKFGNRLHVATDGEDALDFVYQRNAHKNGVRPDIILLDLHLPQKDGDEVLKILKNDSVTRGIPVVVLTGSDIESEAVKDLDVHANCYIAKPMTFLSFIGAIQSLEEFWLGLVILSDKSETEKMAS